MYFYGLDYSVMSKTNFKNIFFLRLLRKLFVLIGILFTVFVIFAFTEQPYWGYHWLGTSKSEMKWKPDVIVLLGGSGMPSHSNLMRSWYAAKASNKFPNARVVIAMPGKLNDSLSTPLKMEQELVLRGVNPENIDFEHKGTNTRSQALNCLQMLNSEKSVLLITSPENMRRTVMCFKKIGFLKVNAMPAFENAAEADFSFEDDDLGGNTTLVPDVGKSMNVRYQVWTHLKYEILIAREMAALFYYRLRGWV